MSQSVDCKDDLLGVGVAAQAHSQSLYLIVAGTAGVPAVAGSHAAANKVNDAGGF